MLRLTTMGSVGLSGPSARPSPHPILAQPKRLALLAYLAVGALAPWSSATLSWPCSGRTTTTPTPDAPSARPCITSARIWARP
jgi:hypothetical protein